MPARQDDPEASSDLLSLMRSDLKRIESAHRAAIGGPCADDLYERLLRCRRIVGMLENRVRISRGPLYQRRSAVAS